jgi:predicted lipid-binding transport protein (Tim44 family)
MTDGRAEPSSQRPLSALPAPTARAAAFVAILLGGLIGGLIGYTLVDVQCEGACTGPRGAGAFFGAVACALGMSVVAVLTLRAIGEWRQLPEHPGHEQPA